MNNIKQKNVIQKLNSNIELPYSNKNYVNLKQCCTSLNAYDINNGMQQLLDNDLYIESYLTNTSSYIQGPKIYNEHTISSEPNGYKAYGDITTANYLDILHKVETPLSSSITKSTKITSKVKFICDYGNLIFIGSDNYLRYSTNPDSDDWSILNGNIIANNFYKSDNFILFAAQDGVYQLITFIEYDTGDPEKDGVIQYKALKLNKTELQNVTSISYDKVTGHILICAYIEKSNKYQLYSGKYFNYSSEEQLNSSIIFNYRYQYDSSQTIINEKINDIRPLQSVQVLAGENGFFEEKTIGQFEDRYSLQYFPKEGEESEDHQYFKSISFNENIYVISDKKIFKQNKQSLDYLYLKGDNINDNIQIVTDLIENNDYLYLSFTGNDLKCHIYRIAKDESYSNILENIVNSTEFDTQNKITCLQFFNNSILLIGTESNGVYQLNINDVESSHSAFLIKINITDFTNEKINCICCLDNKIFIGSSKKLYILSDLNIEYSPTNIINKFEKEKINGIDISDKIIKNLNLNSNYFVVSDSYLKSLSNPTCNWTCPNSINDAILVNVNGNNFILIVTSNLTYLFNVQNNGNFTYNCSLQNDFINIKNVIEYKDQIILLFNDNKLITFEKNSLLSPSTIDYNVIEDDKKQICPSDNLLYTLNTSNQIEAFIQNYKITKVQSFSDDLINNAKYFNKDAIVLYAKDSGIYGQAIQVDQVDDEIEFSILNENSISESKTYDIEFGYDDNKNFLYSALDGKIVQTEIGEYSTSIIDDIKEKYSSQTILLNKTAYNLAKIEKESDLKVFTSKYSRIYASTSNGLYYQDTFDINLNKVESTNKNNFAILNYFNPTDNNFLEKILSSYNNTKKIVANEDGAYILYNDHTIHTIQSITLEEQNLDVQSFGCTECNDILLYQPQINNPWTDTSSSELKQAKNKTYVLFASNKDLYQKELDDYDDIDNPTLDYDWIRNNTLKKLKSFSETIINLDIFDKSDEIFNSGYSDTEYGVLLIVTLNNIYTSSINFNNTLKVYEFDEYQELKYNSSLSKITNIKNAYWYEDNSLIVQSANGIFKLNVTRNGSTYERCVFDIEELYDYTSSLDMNIYSVNSNKSFLHQIHGIKNNKILIDIPKTSIILTSTNRILDEFIDEYKNSEYIIGNGIYQMVGKYDNQFIQVYSSTSIEWVQSLNNKFLYVIYDNGKVGYITDLTDKYEIIDISIDPYLFKKCFIFSITNSSQILYLVEEEKICSIDCKNGIPDKNTFKILYKPFEELKTVKSLINNQIYEYINPLDSSKSYNLRIFNYIFNLAIYDYNYIICGNPGCYYINGYCIDKMNIDYVQAYKLINYENSLAYISLDQKKLYIGISEYSSSDKIYDVILNLPTIFFQKESITGKWYYGYDLTNINEFVQLNENNGFLYGINIKNNINYFNTDIGLYKVDFLQQKQLVFESEKNYDKNIQQLKYKNSSNVKVIAKNSSNNIDLYNYNNNTDELDSVILQIKFNLSVLIENSDPDKNYYSKTVVYETPTISEAWYSLNDNYLYCNLIDNSTSLIDKYTEILKGKTFKHDFYRLNNLNYTQSKILETFNGISLDQIHAVSKYNNFNYIHRNNEVLCFSKYSVFNGYQKINGSENQSYLRLIAIDDDNYLINGSNELLTYNDVGLLAVKSIQLNAVNTYKFSNENQKYIAISDNNILTSDNYKRWNLLFKLPDNITNVNDVYIYSKTNYLFGADNGLFYTKYSYSLQHDVKQFTQEEILQLYNQLFSLSQYGISAQVSQLIKDHIENEHNNESIITRLNNDYINVNMEDIDANWQHSSDEITSLQVQNDIISEIQFGSYIDGDIEIEISNFLNTSDNLTTEITGMTYIMKRWMSGITELFINLPTTNTYYLADVYGANDCKTDPENSYIRKNLNEFDSTIQTQNSVISSHYTDIKVYITSCEYHIDNLLDIQINGNSLPLKIYKTEKSSTESQMLYRSFIEPSIIKNYNIDTTDQAGNYIFNFACFGSDAQAIRLMFFDNNSRIGNEWIRVVFNLNGGETGSMSKQKFLLNNDDPTKPILERKTLKTNKFKNESAGYTKIFIGWTLEPKDENYVWESGEYDGSQIYENNDIFPHSTTYEQLMKELVRDEDNPLKYKEEINLYAVWMTYQFTENDTTLMLNSNKKDFYIDSVGVNENTKLGKNVAINFSE